jgi:hypothetical protein
VLLASHTADAGPARSSKVLGALSAARQGKRALELLLRDMPAAGVRPDGATFGHAMGACVRSGDWRGALGVFDHAADAAAEAEASGLREAAEENEEVWFGEAEMEVEEEGFTEEETWQQCEAAEAGEKAPGSYSQSQSSLSSPLPRRPGGGFGVGHAGAAGLGAKAFRSALQACAMGGAGPKALEVVGLLRQSLEPRLAAAHAAATAAAAAADAHAAGRAGTSVAYAEGSKGGRAASARALHEATRDLLACYNAAIGACGEASMFRDALAL